MQFGNIVLDENNHVVKKWIDSCTIHRRLINEFFEIERQELVARQQYLLTQIKTAEDAQAAVLHMALNDLSPKNAVNSGMAASESSAVDRHGNTRSPVITDDELNGWLKTTSSWIGREKTLELLGEYGASKVGEVTNELRPKLLAACKLKCAVEERRHLEDGANNVNVA